MTHAQTVRLPLRLPVEPAPFLMAAFLYAGNFKGDPRLNWLPVDLTLALGAAIAALLLWRLLTARFRIPQEAIAVLFLFGLLAIPLPWTEWHPYASEKVTRFFTLTLLAALAPLWLVRSRTALRHLFSSMAALGGLLAISALLTLGQGILSTARLSAFGANPIAFGRAMGQVVLWAALLGVEGRIGPLAGMWTVGITGILLIASGSRGPLLASVGCLVLAGFLFYRRSIGLVVRFALAAGVIFLAVQGGLTTASDESGSRITRFVQGELGPSELTRVDAYRKSGALMLERPLGIGWGGFASEVDQTGQGGHERQYPHNLVLEALLEGGWLPGGALILLAGLSLLRSLRHRPASLELRALFLFLCFALGNAMVSGDLNDNRLLFALMAMGLRTRWDDDGSVQSGAADLRPRSGGPPDRAQGVSDAGGSRLRGRADPSP